MDRISWLAEKLSASQVGHCSVDLFVFMYSFHSFSYILIRTGPQPHIRPSIHPSFHPCCHPLTILFIHSFWLFKDAASNWYDMALNVGCVLNSEMEEICGKKVSWHNLGRQPDIYMQKLSKTTNLSVRSVSSRRRDPCFTCLHSRWYKVRVCWIAGECDGLKIHLELGDKEIPTEF